MSNNLTSTVSCETSMLCPQQASSSSLVSPPNQPPTKKKRGLPGKPDPDAEVIALSPKSLLSTNRFICEICNKGFQREQNLQLHRRGHNLPWKLKQRDKDQIIRKKVYVCPVPTCVHHDPARALGDLTGIKKHYCRKHGEKKWKCDKCTKKYAVQSDWKAHSKICGTREYRCDCGTPFSRRDSFITHRAFCDALAEAGRGGGSSTTLPSLITQLPTHLSSNLRNPLHSLPLKREDDDQHLNFNTRMDIPPWLACPPPPPQQEALVLDHRQHSQQAGSVLEPGPPSMPSSHMDDHMLFFQQYSNQYQHQYQHQHDPSPSLGHGKKTLSSFQTQSSPHMSATALLQRAVEVGVTVSSNHYQQQQQQYHQYQHQNHQVPSHGAMFSTSNKTQPHTHVSMGISTSREVDHHNHANTGFIEGQIVTSHGVGEAQSSMLHDMMIMSSFQSSASTKSGSGIDAPPALGDCHQHHRQEVADGGKKGGEGLTRDFLGLRTYFHKDLLNMAGLGHMNSSSSSSAPFDHQQLDHQNQTPW